jgi:hypothetical protein
MMGGGVGIGFVGGGSGEGLGIGSGGDGGSGRGSGDGGCGIEVIGTSVIGGSLQGHHTLGLVDHGSCNKRSRSNTQT